MTKYKKALVIGGGPSGALCALMLRRFSFPEVQILERHSRHRDKACAGGISPRGITELHRLELLHLVQKNATLIKGANLRAPSGHKARVVVGQMALVMRRSVFDEFLLRQAEAAGAKIRSDTAVDRLLTDGDRVVGVGVGEEELEADVVVVATGARNALNWDTRPRERLDAIIVRLEGADVEKDMMHVSYHPRLAPYYFWLFPEPEGTVNIGLFRRSGPGQRKLVDLLDEVLHDSFPELLSATRIGRVRGHPIVYSHKAQQLVKPGALRVGEAGWLTDAFTGEGIWHALVSGREAAKAIAMGDLEQYSHRVAEELDPALRSADRLRRLASTRAWSLVLRAAQFKPFGLITGKLMGGLTK